MKPRNLIIASVLLLGLAALLRWGPKQNSSTESATPPPPKLADIPPAQVDRVAITKRSGPVAVERSAGRWAITSPQPYTADQDAVSTMLSSLNPLNADSVVQEKPKDFAQFGLDAPPITVAIKQRNGKTDQLQIGNDVPTTSFVYARWNSGSKVFAISNSVKTAFDKSVNDLRDKRLLTFDTGKLTRVELASAKGDVEFGKNNQGDWQILKPQPYRADSFTVEDLVRKLGDAKMDLSSTPDSDAKAKSAFASGQHLATVKVSDASGTQTLEVRKNKDDYYASSSVVPGDYKIPSDVGQALDKGVDDFRNKKLFDFGFNDPNKLELQQGGTDKTYVRSGTDWKSNGQTTDAGTVQAFIDKLRDASAAKFVTAGFDQPVASVTVQSNDYKRTEKVEFAKAADGFIARRDGEAALFQLDGKSVNDILEAGKGIKPAASGSKK